MRFFVILTGPPVRQEGSSETAKKSQPEDPSCRTGGPVRMTKNRFCKDPVELKLKVSLNS